jgi:hypothetical protein
MNRSLQPALALWTIGLLGLSVLAIVYHGFALDWRPAPPWLSRPNRSGLRLRPPEHRGERQISAKRV